MKDNEKIEVLAGLLIVMIVFVLGWLLRGCIESAL